MDKMYNLVGVACVRGSDFERWDEKLLWLKKNLGAPTGHYINMRRVE